MGTVLQHIALLKLGVGCRCPGENQLIEVLNGWAFLNFWGPMDPLGLPISWILMQVERLEVPLLVIIWVVDLWDTPTVLISIGISLLATFQFTTGESLTTRTALDAFPMTISSKRNVRTAYKALPQFEIPSVVAWWTRGMTPSMISQISFFANIFL